MSPPVHEGAKLVFPDPAHDEDRLRNARPAQLETLLDDRDREDRRAFLREATRHVPGAMAVCVRLDDRHHGAALRQRTRDRPVVRRERVEIDDGVRWAEWNAQSPGPSLIIARSEKRVYSPDQPSVKRSVGPLRCLAMMTSQTFFCSVSLS